MQFLDFVHAVKPEHHNEVPTGLRPPPHLQEHDPPA